MILDLIPNDPADARALPHRLSFIANCNASSNYLGGISAGGDTTVSNCTATDNTFDGYTLNGGNIVRDCLAINNFQNGIFFMNDASLIEHNNVVYNATGLRGSTTGVNLVIRNSLRGNTTAYDFGPAPNTMAAPFIGKAGITSNTNPDANYAY